LESGTVTKGVVVALCLLVAAGTGAVVHFADHHGGRISSVLNPSCTLGLAGADVRVTVTPDPGSCADLAAKWTTQSNGQQSWVPEHVPPQDGLTCRLRSPDGSKTITVRDSDLAIYGSSICSELQSRGW
jgi:hypothetical protein